MIAPDPLDADRALRLRQYIERLIEANHYAPVIVEGKNDVIALRLLGLTGEIITINQGRPLYDICEGLAETHRQMILLTDWDSIGDDLDGKLRRNLRGQCEEAAFIREALRSLCQKDISAVEDIPALLRRLEGDTPAARI